VSNWSKSTHVRALLAAAACLHAQPRQKTDLANTSWQLVQFRGANGESASPDDKTKYTISFGSDGSLSARIDCNRAVGAWKTSAPNQIQFGPVALTRAMCPPGSSNERLGQDLELITSYQIRDDHLLLSLMDGKGVYEFERIGSSGQDALRSGVASKGPVNYRCMGPDSMLSATFYSTAPAMVLVEWSKTVRPAFQVPAASILFNTVVIEFEQIST